MLCQTIHDKKAKANRIVSPSSACDVSGNGGNSPQSHTSSHPFHFGAGVFWRCVCVCAVWREKCNKSCIVQSAHHFMLPSIKCTPWLAMLYARHCDATLSMLHQTSERANALTLRARAIGLGPAGRDRCRVKVRKLKNRQSANMMHWNANAINAPSHQTHTRNACMPRARALSLHTLGTYNLSQWHTFGQQYIVHTRVYIYTRAI